MKYTTLIFLIITLASFWERNAFAQVANFDASPTSGCPTLTVSFTNTSTPATGLTYSWDFGNLNTSTEKNPSASYILSGTYTVSLRVSADGGTTWSAPYTKTITVFHPPVANFTASPTKGCASISAPLTVQFTDQSTIGDATLKSYEWNIAGNIKTEPNPTFDFKTEDKHDISLIITDNNNCTASIQKTDLIDVANPPFVGFDPDHQSSCKIPDTVHFTNNSSGLGVFNYYWSFGENPSSTIKNPSHIYHNSGNYDVTLRVTSDYGCDVTSSATQISVYEVKAIGTLTQGGNTITDGAYVCADVGVSFANQSTGNPSITWDYGDGTNLDDNPPNPTTHTYTTAGTYVVKLIARGINCVNIAMWTINIEKVTANFTFSPTESCSSPVNVQFTNTSSTSASIISYLWTFYDNNTRTDQNTSKLITASADKDEYVIHQPPENFITTLNVTSTHNCTSTTSGTFIINRPTALFSVDTAKGCFPLKVTFTSKSQSGSQITSCYWDFGDGKDTTTTFPIISAPHTYLTNGTYQTRLTITNNKGCTDTSDSIPITVGKVPIPAFHFSTGTNPVCSSDLVSITYDPSSGDNVDYWQYTINGQSINACPDESSPTFKLKPDVGALTVKLIAGNNGCYAETTRALTNNGPKSSFSDSITDCANPRDYTFKGSTTGTVVKWDFGNLPTSTLLNPTHTFASANSNYTVKFITSDGGTCMDTVIQTVRVRLRNAQFTLPSPAEGCANQSISFNGTGSHPMTDFCRDKYIWDFKDNTPLIRTDHDSIKHIFTNRGSYKVLMTAIYDNGCTDSLSHRIRIYQPYAGVTADTTQGCINLEVIFTDTSLPDDNPLSKFVLDFGDQSKDSTIIQGHIFTPHTYTYPSIYPAVLTVTDSKTCTDTAGLYIRIGTPDASFTIDPANICAYDSIFFSYNLNGGDSLEWNFGDGVKSGALTSQIGQISHKYIPYSLNKFQGYLVTITMYQYSCPKSSPDSVHVLRPDAKFTLTDSVLDCPPKNITFTHSNPSSEIASGVWSVGFPEKTYPYDSLPKTYTYLRAGNDTIHLSITTKPPLSCKASFSQIVKVKGPVAYYNISADTACKKDEIIFTLHDTTNVTKFEWDYGDGNVVNGNSLIQKHRYSSVGKKYVTLLLHSGTCDAPGIPDSIYLVEVIAKFSVIDTSVCELIPINFINASKGNNQQNWNFGDGTNTSAVSPSHPFADTGSFKVILAVSNATGCKDTAIRVMTIHPNPAITVSLDKSKCSQNIMLLHAAGGDKVAWYPKNGLNDSTSNNPEAKPLSTVYYKAKAIYTSTGCFKIDSLLVTRANVTLHPTDTTAVIGDQVPIYFTDSSYVKSFHWTPVTYLSDTNRLDPIASPSADIIYNLILHEPSGCFIDTVKVKIKIDWTKLDFDVPKAFKPGSDDINSVLKVRGRGIRELLEYKIYNRWGNLVFSSTDLSKGWDGKYQGKDQPIDTYVWTVIVKNYSDEIIKKKGTVLLMR